MEEMAVAISDAPITTYSDTTAHKKAVADLISIIDPMDTPVVAYFGLNGSASQFRIPVWPAKKAEWLQDDYASLAGSLNGSITSNATTITVTDGTKYKKGYVLEIDSEMMWVSSVSSEVATVVRNYGGTQASHDTGAVVSMIDMNRLEGADTTDDYKTDVVTDYNYTKILHAGIKVTRTMAKLSQWGISDEFDYQVAKKIPELTRLMEIAFFRGQRKSGSTTAPRGMGGLETFVTDNTASIAGVALTEVHVNDRIQAIWEDGGKPNLMICGAWVKRKLSSFYTDTVRTERLEDRGGVVINHMLTEFGEMDILMSRWCPKTKLYIVTPEHIGFIPFDAFFQEEMAKSGDYTRGEVIGEYTLVVRHDKAHGFISSISTTA